MTVQCGIHISVSSLACIAEVASARYLDQVVRTAKVVGGFVAGTHTKRAKASAYGRLNAARERYDAAAENLFQAVLRGDA